VAARPEKESSQSASVTGDRPIFGDLDWIARRGKVPSRRYKVRAKKPKPDEHQEMWFRIEGRWVRFRCATCQTTKFTLVKKVKGRRVRVLCRAGHYDEVMDAFYLERPEVEEEE
jgi:hypothetical protein